MRAIDMLRDMLPGTPDPLGVRFSSAGIFVLVKQETLPWYCRLVLLIHAAFTDAYPERAATTSSLARPKEYSRRDVSRSEILGA